MIVLIIAAGGAFKQVLTDSGVAEYIKQLASGVEFNPLILAWCVAAVIRLAIGSATVATMTAAGIMLPIVGSTGVSPELMVLATGSGSLMFSHFNDIGFWMFKEYYNVSIKQTFAIWTVMESLVAIVGLLAALLLSIFI
jgi:H+/gluconate symporter-like permease